MNERVKMYTAVLICGALAGYVGAMIAMERPVRQLKVQQIDIVSQNKVVATLGTTNGSGSLMLKYDNGRPAVVLGVANKQPGLSLMDSNGSPRKGAATGHDGAGIWLSNAKGNDLIAITVENNFPLVSLKDARHGKSYGPF